MLHKSKTMSHVMWLLTDAITTSFAMAAVELFFFENKKKHFNKHIITITTFPGKTITSDCNMQYSYKLQKWFLIFRFWT